MAEISKDFTNDQSRYQEVLFQRGKKVIDGELNDLQRVIRVAAIRSSLLQDDNAGEIAGTHGFIRAVNLEITNSGTNNEVVVQPIAGSSCYISYRGYVFQLTETLTFVTEGTGSARDQQLYLTIDEVEVSSGGDPNIATSQLGETAVRIQLEVTFLLATTAAGDASGAATTSDSEPYNGAIKGALIARIKRLSATPDQPVEANEIFHQWKPWRSFSEFMDFGRGAHFCSADSTNTAYVYVHTAAADTLVIQNLGVYMGPGNFDTVELAVMKYDLTGSYSLPNPGDCLVLKRMTAPRGLGTPSLAGTFAQTIAAAVSPTAEQVELVVENWADYTDAQNPPNEDGFDQRTVIAVRETSGTYFTMMDRQSIRTVIGVTGQSPGEARLSWSPGNTDTTVNLSASLVAASSPGLVGSQLPYFVTQTPPAAANLKLLSAHKIQLGANLGLQRVYMASKLNLSIPTNGVGLTEFAGIIRTVNARWTDTVNAEWAADDSSEASWVIYEGMDTDGANAAGINATSLRDSTQAGTWDKNAWNNNGVIGGMHVVTNDFTQSITVIRHLTASLKGFKFFQMSGTTDPVFPASPIKNSLYGLNVPKVIGRVSIAAEAITVLPNSFNMASAALAGSAIGRVIVVTLNIPWTTAGECTVSVIPVGKVTRTNGLAGVVDVAIIQQPSILVGTIGFIVRDITNGDDDPWAAAGGNATAEFAIVAYGQQAAI